MAREGRCAIVPHQEILVREAPTTRTDRETEKQTCRGMKKESERTMLKGKNGSATTPDDTFAVSFLPPIDFAFRVVSRGPIFPKLSITSTVCPFLYDARRKKKQRQVAADAANHRGQKRNRKHLRLRAIARKSRQTALVRTIKARCIAAEKIFCRESTRYRI